MHSTTQLPFVGLISRPKLGGFGQHSGVLLPSGHVAHMTPNGAAIVTSHQFAQGETIKYEKAAPQQRYGQIQWRAEQSVRRVQKYDLLNRNCEHYSTWLIGEEPKSSQVTAAAVLTVIGIVAALAS